MKSRTKAEPGLKNPKGFTVNGVSFNEYFVAGKSLANWQKYAKAQYEGRPFIGRRNEAQQDELFAEVHKIATDMVNPPKEAIAIPKAEPKTRA
jgi:hypothetical protein